MGWGSLYMGRGPTYAGPIYGVPYIWGGGPYVWGEGPYDEVGVPSMG